MEALSPIERIAARRRRLIMSWLGFWFAFQLPEVIAGFSGHGLAPWLAITLKIVSIVGLFGSLAHSVLLWKLHRRARLEPHIAAAWNDEFIRETSRRSTTWGYVTIAVYLMLLQFCANTGWVRAAPETWIRLGLLVCLTTPGIVYLILDR